MNWNRISEQSSPLGWFILAGLLACGQISSAKAADLVLRANPVASGNHILIGDIFENAGSYADKPLALAPLANQKTSFAVDALRARLGSYGLKWQIPAGMNRIEVFGTPDYESQNAPSATLNSAATIGEIPVLNRDIARDETITYDMISYQKTNNIYANTIADPAKLIGARAKIAIRANSPIRNNEIGQALMVRKGSNVILVQKIGALKITLQAKSLDDGITGGRIRVVNLQSNKTIDAIVDGDGTAHAIGANTQTLASR